jgi:hypothetical protein
MTPYPLGEKLIVPPPGEGYDWYYLAQFHNDIGGVTRGVRGLSFQDLGGFGCCILGGGSSGVKITQNDQKLTGFIHVPSNRPDAWRNAAPGTYESRFTVDTTSKFGKRQYNSTRWYAQLNTPGVPVIARARGWYEGSAFEYVDATLTTKVRASTLANGTAIRPGQTLTYSIGAGAKWASVFFDPALHCACPEAKGRVIFENRLGSSGSFVVPSDLSPGIHVLMIVGTEVGSTGWSAGVMRIPFQVN